MIPTLEWLPTGVNFLDQTKLPLEETYVLATDYKQVATVIRDMIVRELRRLEFRQRWGCNWDRAE